MPKQPAKSGQNDLDQSIDQGLDQFGRFLKGSWFWLLIVVFVLWFFISGASIGPFDGPTMLAIGLQILIAVLFVGVQFFMWFFFMGKPRMYWVLPGETGVSFEDYKGNPEVLEAAKRTVALLRGVKSFQDMGGTPVRGLLLSGPPGTGKSYLAQCISTETGVPFGYVSAASLRGIFMGMDVLAVKRLYGKARRYARDYGGCVIFLDELDAIGGSRSGQGPTMGMGGGGMMGMGNGTGGLNELLMQMDPPSIETGWFKKVLRVLGLYNGKVQMQPVLTIGATNLPESLDQALLRPGRFDRKIHVGPPTDRYRPEVIEYYLNKVEHDDDISIPTLSARLVNYTPVAIKHVVNEAVIVAHFDGRDRVTYKDLIEAQDVHEYGLRQVSDLTPIERRRLAYHEAGHTVATYYLLDRYFPAYVTLHMRGDVEGAAAFAHPRQKETVITKNQEDILGNIQVALASRAAEELFLNTKLSGVSGDFSTATQLATAYIGVFGMDSSLTSIHNTSVSIPKLEERVERLLQSQLNAVKQLLLEHSEALIAVAEALIEKDELLADDIKKLIDAADARSATRLVLKDFKPLLEADNGRSNGNGNGNGHTTGRLHTPQNENAVLNNEKNDFPPLSGYDIVE